MKDAKDLKVGDNLSIKSNEHWEVKFPCVEGKNDLPYASFLPMSGTKRAQPHRKVNEQDH